MDKELELSKLMYSYNQSLFLGCSTILIALIVSHINMYIILGFFVALVFSATSFVYYFLKLKKRYTSNRNK